MSKKWCNIGFHLSDGVAVLHNAVYDVTVLWGSLTNSGN